MKTPLHPDPRPNRIAAEQFNAMLASPAWQRYSERLGEMAARLSHTCIAEHDEILLRWAQGGAQTLSSILSLPEGMAQELKKDSRPAE